MKDHPILFSAPMVHALLGGRKTQTRRIVRGAPDGALEVVPSLLAHRGDLWDFRRHRQNPHAIRCPYGAPGDRLWVKETFGVLTGNGHRLVYRADGERPPQLDPHARMTWRPSIFMRRAQSRITLEVTRVRVERLQDITEADAKAEGVPCDSAAAWRGDFADAVARGHRAAFEALWDEINGDRAAWTANPFVWAVDFRRVELAR